MGLDFHAEGLPYEEDIPFDERAHWSYSGFNRFRERLYKQIDNGKTIDWTKEPLLPLLLHSDCDGILTPLECSIIGPALALAVWDWKPAEDYDRVNAIKLSAHMHYCACSGRNLEFC